MGKPSKALLEANAKLMEMRRAHQEEKKRALHRQYLRSPKWQILRGKVFRRDGYICQECHENLARQVHHLTYTRWGNERMEDLISVCDPCHKRIHGNGE